MTCYKEMTEDLSGANMFEGCSVSDGGLRCSDSDVDGTGTTVPAVSSSLLLALVLA